MKKCIKCHIEKEYLDFSKNKSKKDGHNNMCKLCFSEYSKQYEKTDKRQAYLKSEKRKARAREISKNIYNTEERRLYLVDYKNKNKEYIKKYKREYQFNKRNNDDIYRFKASLRSLINSSFLRYLKNRKDTKTTEILGCDIEYFKLYLASKFEDWMNWQNYGNRNMINGRTWELDHIVPLCLANTKDDVVKLNHYTNFQPLCSSINRSNKPKPTPPPFN